MSEFELEYYELKEKYDALEIEFVAYKSKNKNIMTLFFYIPLIKIKFK
jgi:hypothetical protein